MRLEDKKIMELRKANGVSQLTLASAIYFDVDKVIKVEKGRASYSNGQLESAKKFFDIEGMPLSEFECDVAKKRLYLMRDLARDSKLDEAKAICEEMANLVNLEPCDDELPLLYRLLEVVVLFDDDTTLDIVEEKLNYLQSRFDDMNTEHRYYFYYLMGFLKIWRRCHEEGLVLCKQALEIHESSDDFALEESDRLRYNIAICYSYLQFPYRAIFCIHKIRELNGMKRINTPGTRLSILLAHNYIRVNELDEAEKLLTNCLVWSKSIKNDLCVGSTLDVFARLHAKKKDWGEAIKCLNQALKYFKEGDRGYFAALYLKIHCMAENKNYAKAKRLLEETSDIYSADEIFLDYFKSLSYYLTVKSRLSIYNDKEVEYIEKVAIPNFIKDHDCFIAIG